MKNGKEKERKTNLTTLAGLIHYYTLLSKEFLLFSTMPISIETVTLVRTTIAVRLMIPFAIHAFEDMRTWLAFFGSHSISFFVIHAALRFLSVVFGDMSSIAFCYNQCLLESTWTWVKGMTTTIGCAGVVSVSTSCGRHCNPT